LAQWRLFPPTVRGGQSHPAGQISDNATSPSRLLVSSNFGQSGHKQQIEKINTMKIISIAIKTLVIIVISVFLIVSISDLIVFLYNPENYPIGTEVVDKAGWWYRSNFTFILFHSISIPLLVLLLLLAFKSKKIIRWYRHKIQTKKPPLSNKELKKKEWKKAKKREKREEMMWKIVSIIFVIAILISMAVYRVDGRSEEYLDLWRRFNERHPSIPLTPR
jgi:hypothetical protein